ncbi:GIY-YIG nuclease family protein [Bacillus sp. JCM 19041]|uniref:GIY-YIG nuclease family protein n=1 Tax=Bacillus sp. JCM 19041 TaxID=1460637 RepID=UPI000AB9C9DB
MNHVMYVLECCDGTWYTGYTNDFESRLAKHKSGKGAKYTRGRGPFKVIWKESFATKEEAMKREYAFKRYTRQKKEMYIARRKEEDDD